MTVLEAIRQADLHLPNGFSVQEKLRWLSRLDGLIFREIHSLYEDCTEDFGGYEGETALHAELLAAEPYGEELYLRYLERCMDDANGDTDRLINSQRQFRAAYETYARHYNRSHRIQARARRK